MGSKAIVTRRPKLGTPAYCCWRVERTLKVFAVPEELVSEPPECVNPPRGAK